MKLKDKPERDYKVICAEIDGLLIQRDMTYVQIGERLCELRGYKHNRIKREQIWRQDPRAEGLTNFTDYCQRVWGSKMDQRSVYQYMKAYEVYMDIEDDGEMPSSERAMRPITRLKSKEDQKSAMEYARIVKKRLGGARLTAAHTAEGVRILREMKRGNKADDQRRDRVATKNVEADFQLESYAAHGIGYADAMRAIQQSWDALIDTLEESTALSRDELCDKMAEWYQEFLRAKYNIC